MRAARKNVYPIYPVNCYCCQHFYINLFSQTSQTVSGVKTPEVIQVAAKHQRAHFSFGPAPKGTLAAPKGTVPFGIGLARTLVNLCSEKFGHATPGPPILISPASSTAMKLIAVRDFLYGRGSTN